MQEECYIVVPQMSKLINLCGQEFVLSRRIYDRKLFPTLLAGTLPNFRQNNNYPCNYCRNICGSFVFQRQSNNNILSYTTECIQLKIPTPLCSSLSVTKHSVISHMKNLHLDDSHSYPKCSAPLTNKLILSLHRYVQVVGKWFSLNFY